MPHPSQWYWFFETSSSKNLHFLQKYFPMQAPQSEQFCCTSCCFVQKEQITFSISWRGISCRSRGSISSEFCETEQGPVFQRFLCVRPKPKRQGRQSSTEKMYVARKGEGNRSEDRTLASLWQCRQPKTSPQQGATTLHPRL
uniref:Uncharacterized protein n=1 Tax=Arundo donax TaxID=35708 RepID=A0A0A9GA76_ARUDO